MSLLKKLLSNSRKAELGFGIHENCVITAVSNSIRKNKDGEKLPRNCFTKFEMRGEDGAVLAEKEISWFNLDHTKDYAVDNFLTQLEQQSGIVDALRLHDEESDPWAEEVEDILSDLGIVSDEPEVAKAQLKEALGDKKVLKSISEKINDLYETFVSDAIKDDETFLRLKLVFDSNGRSVQQPKFESFVENSKEVSLERSILKITARDEEYKAKSLEATKKPNAAPMGKI